MLFGLFLCCLNWRFGERLVPRADRHGGARHLVKQLIVRVLELSAGLLLNHKAAHCLAEVLLVVHGLFELEAPHQQRAADGDEAEAADC